MAGHSKWANIKFRKMGQDAKRGKLFTKYIREITVATRQGGGDPSANARLRAAMDKALSANMTRDTIDRAIKRGLGPEEGQALSEVRYEGYGPGGVAMMVDCMTDNHKRTVAEVRHLFTKYGGNLGVDGSVSYLFESKGQLTFAANTDEEALTAAALEADVEDVQAEAEGTLVVTTQVLQFNQVKQHLEANGLRPVNAEITLVPSTWMAIEESNVAEKLMGLIEALEDLEDVQTVYSNANISESLLIEFSER